MDEYKPISGKGISTIQVKCKYCNASYLHKLETRYRSVLEVSSAVLWLLANIDEVIEHDQKIIDSTKDEKEKRWYGGDVAGHIRVRELIEHAFLDWEYAVPLTEDDVEYIGEGGKIR